MWIHKFLGHGVSWLGGGFAIGLILAIIIAPQSVSGYDPEAHLYFKFLLEMAKWCSLTLGFFFGILVAVFQYQKDRPNKKPEKKEKNDGLTPKERKAVKEIVGGK
jgi:predicted histidine transporter YuiF (NhaC family)